MLTVDSINSSTRRYWIAVLFSVAPRMVLLSHDREVARYLGGSDLMKLWR
jgi:hypothetical protein